jgi:hypothetical protein
MIRLEIDENYLICMALNMRAMAIEGGDFGNIRNIRTFE